MLDVKNAFGIFSGSFASSVNFVRTSNPANTKKNNNKEHLKPLNENGDLPEPSSVDRGVSCVKNPIPATAVKHSTRPTDNALTTLLLTSSPCNPNVAIPANKSKANDI